MESDSLNAISPVDGRYQSKCAALAPYFSEFALMQYRVRVEIEYFIALCEIPLPQLQNFDANKFAALRNVYLEFSEHDAKHIKTIEATTNHDVKAVEYFIKNKFDQLHLSEYKEFIHFGLTSQDVNNTAIPLSLKEAVADVYKPELKTIAEKLLAQSLEWKEIVMMARTHGQPASPTKLGKEFYVFFERIQVQLVQLDAIIYSAKFGGATGNFNAHHIAYPQIKWVPFANKFVADLGLSRSQTTTQIEHYDNMAALFDCMKRINTILIDMCRDIWAYISMGYFGQSVKAGEIGSSAMPHKVNPIDFENAEGNLGIANALYEFFSAKLPISRLQRDLTDSTVLRNVGVPIAHTSIAFKSILRGLDKIKLNEKIIAAELDENWAVVAEAIQTILRRENYPNPYEKLKELTRTGGAINREVIKDFIETLAVAEDIKIELRKISPANYYGVF
jgi:adenylosuccinate lyase